MTVYMRLIKDSTVILEWTDKITDSSYQTLYPTRFQKTCRREYRMRHRQWLIQDVTKKRRARDRHREEITYTIEGECNANIRDILEDIVCPLVGKSGPMNKSTSVLKFVSPQCTRNLININGQTCYFDYVVGTNLTVESIPGRPFTELQYRYTLVLEEVQEIY